MLQAKTHLSRLVLALDTGAVEEILITRHGRPVARLTRPKAAAGPVRIGLLTQAATP
jgi:antitoxin (DNA-binding transcriptional repressor) of toxin-antitoxin stability system